MFTPAVKRAQAQHGSRAAYARLEAPRASAEPLQALETSFIAERDSFYLATVSETGWPYVQHRGGPPGFLKVLNERTVGFADYRGNKQYISVGALEIDDRISMILVDYPHRRRLKLIGRARMIQAGDDPALLTRLQDDYPAKVERAMVISVEAFDWNCPQHITPRFTEAELEPLLTPLRDRLRALEAENAALRSGGATAPL